MKNTNTKTTDAIVTTATDTAKEVTMKIKTSPKYPAPIHTTLGTANTVLSTNERLVLEFMMANNNCGATTVGQLINDNMSWAEASEIQNFTGWSRHKVAGVISAMDKKGLITFDPGSKFSDVPPMWYVEEWFMRELDPQMKLEFPTI